MVVIGGVILGGYKASKLAGLSLDDMLTEMEVGSQPDGSNPCSSYRGSFLFHICKNRSEKRVVNFPLAERQKNWYSIEGGNRGEKPRLCPVL